MMLTTGCVSIDGLWKLILQRGRARDESEHIALDWSEPACLTNFTQQHSLEIYVCFLLTVKRREMQ